MAVPNDGAQLVDVAAWRRWLTSRRGAARWRTWAERHRALGGWTIDELAAPGWSPRTDRLQHDLVALAQAGEGDAAVTLLVQLRPGLERLVRWWAAAGRARCAGVGTTREARDEVRAVFNETLYRHRLDRRPRRIAANLVLDTRQRLDRAGRRAGRLHPIPSPVIDRGPAVVTGPSGAPIDPAEAVAARAAILRLGRVVAELPGSDRSRSLTATAAYRAWILGEPHAAIAADLGLAPPAVATRLRRLRVAARREWDRAA